MITWNQHKQFSSEFLAEHHDLVLYDVFHHIKAFLLFSPNCSCENSCRCPEWREKIILALNTNLYNKACKTGERPERLYAMKTLWRIPEDHFFREHYAEAYPLWAIKKKLKARMEEFKIIDKLIWAFLRLGKTTSDYRAEPEVSLNAATKILKEDSEKERDDRLKQSERPWGKKKCAKQFERYEPVCHFIAALKIWESEMPNGEKAFISLDSSPAAIERFLSLAHWFRKQLLSLTRPNVTENVFLVEENICPLPTWVQSEGIDFPIEPFEEMLKEVWANAKCIDPKTKIATPFLIN